MDSVKSVTEVNEPKFFNATNEKKRMPIIEMKGIYKEFPGVIANNYVNFTLYEGEVHALLGENGAGKTTLMNILYGIYKADKGEIYFKGRKVSIRSPKDAIKLGITMIHQHFKLVENATVAENIILSMRDIGFFVSLKKVKEKIKELAKRYGLKIDPEARIWHLSASERQRVEIFRALIQNPKVLIMDEPTSYLTPQEVRDLTKFLRKFRDEGGAVVFITHKLHEAIDVADRITIMKLGKVVGTINVTEDLRRDFEKFKSIAVKMMFERETPLQLVKPVMRSKAKHVLEVHNLHVESDRGFTAVKGFTFTVREGEIVGIAGIAGNGQKELAEALAGLRKVKKGKIIIEGKDLTNRSSRDFIKMGVAFIPDDRIGVGISPQLPVMDNIILRNYFNDNFTISKFFLRYSEIKRVSTELIREFSIKTPSLKQQAVRLSGGNIQRLILARELSFKPRLIIAYNPTAGLDVAGANFVHSKLIEMVKKGTAVLLISEDLDEIMALSDRIIVIHAGEKMGELPRSKADIETVGQMMLGLLKL